MPSYIPTGRTSTRRIKHTAGTREPYITAASALTFDFMPYRSVRSDNFDVGIFLCQLCHVSLMAFSLRWMLAFGAARTAAAVIDRCMPFCATAPALPPSLFVAAGSHILRGQFSVLCVIPFICQVGIGCGQIIEASEHLFVGAVRTAPALNSA